MPDDDGQSGLVTGAEVLDCSTVSLRAWHRLNGSDGRDFNSLYDSVLFSFVLISFVLVKALRYPT